MYVYIYIFVCIYIFKIYIEIHICFERYLYSYLYVYIYIYMLICILRFIFLYIFRYIRPWWRTGLICFIVVILMPTAIPCDAFYIKAIALNTPKLLGFKHGHFLNGHGGCVFLVMQSVLGNSHIVVAVISGLLLPRRRLLRT